MDANLSFEMFQNEDFNQFVEAFGSSPAPPSIIKKLYFGSTQANSVAYVNAGGTVNSNVQIYIGSTKVFG